jgi:hypothetical protein
MKKSLLKLVAATLAILVLFSTFSFTVEKHFCGDFLMDISFTGEADKCEMDHSNEMMISCCKDEIAHIEGVKILQQEVEKDLNFKTQQVLIAFFQSYTNSFHSYKPKNLFLRDFSPPDISDDFQVSFQCFLI